MLKKTTAGKAVDVIKENGTTQNAYFVLLSCDGVMSISPWIFEHRYSVYSTRTISRGIYISRSIAYMDISNYCWIAHGSYIMERKYLGEEMIPIQFLLSHTPQQGSGRAGENKQSSTLYFILPKHHNLPSITSTTTLRINGGRWATLPE